MLAGVLAAQLSLLGGGCSGAPHDGGRKPTPTASPDDPSSQSSGGANGLTSLSQTSMAEYLRDEPKILPSNGPRRVLYPPTAASSLLADPPGRVTAVSFESDTSVDEYYEHRAFGDIVRYFYGDDGRWRALNLAELGIAASDFAGADTGVGALSPNGRFWAFRTLTRVAIVDLNTGSLTLTKAGEEWRNRPEWGSGGILMAQRIGEPWIAVDPRTGESRALTTRPLDDRPVAFSPEGDMYRVAGRPGSPAKVLRNLSDPSASVDIPFRLVGFVGVYFESERLAFLQTWGLDENVISERTVANYRVIVTDRAGNPVAVLPMGQRLYGSVSVLGWANSQMLLLLVGPDVYAWEPLNDKMWLITTVEDRANADLAVRALTN